MPIADSSLAGTVTGGVRTSRFTLIELLTVMALVGLLAGLLLPALAAARAKTRAASCMSQVRQIGIALHGYVGDSNDRLPCCARLGTDPVLGLPPLAQVLAVPADSRELFHCPADLGSASLFQEAGTSYEWNTFVNGHRIDRATFTIVGMEISAPLLGDAEGFHLRKSRNYLYPDGRVAASLDILIR